MTMNPKKSKYKEYGNIYAEECVHCLIEGSYHCKLEICDGHCKNFKNKNKHNLLLFGGY